MGGQMSAALRKAAMNMVNAASRDWPSSPVTRAAVIGAAAALRDALDGLVQQEQAQFIQECYGDCVTGNPKTCPNPCSYQGRPRP